MRATVRNAVRHGILVAGLALMVVAVMPAAALAAKPSDPFHGSYRSVDFDGSNQLLAFGGPDQPPNAVSGPDGIRRVVYLDDFGTVCGGARFFAEGVGYVDGDSILVVFEIYCGKASVPIGEDVIVFTFDSATGTLTDTYDIVWSRP